MAEGVETKEQLEWMYRIGVDRIQGFYFARPMPEDNLRMVFAEQEKNRMINLQLEDKEEKKVAIRYAGKSEKLQNLAFAFAEAAGVKVSDVSVPLTKAVDILFIGNDNNETDEEAAKNFVCEHQDKIKKTVNFVGA